MRLSRVSVTFKEFTERACQVCCIRVWCVQTCNLLIYWRSPLQIKSGLLKWLPALVALFISFQDWLLASAYCCCSVGLPFRNTCMLRARSSSFFLSKCSCLIKFTLGLFIFLPAVDKANMMVGSYGPKPDIQCYQTPIDDAPKGMLARGHYTVKSKFTDDDATNHLNWEWAFDIKKEWE